MNPKDFKFHPNESSQFREDSSSPQLKFQPKKKKKSEPLHSKTLATQQPPTLPPESSLAKGEPGGGRDGWVFEVPIQVLTFPSSPFSLLLSTLNHPHPSPRGSPNWGPLSTCEPRGGGGASDMASWKGRGGRV